MKKFLVVVFATLLILSMATLTLAVEFSQIIGGRYYGYFSTIDGDRGFNPSPGVDCWDTVLGGTVREGNTWASIKFIADSWNQKIYHSFGIDNIAGSPLSLGFDSHDSGTANVGQQFMGDLFNDFKADPYFNTADMAGSVFTKYITDTVEVRAEAKVYDSDGDTDNTVDYDDKGNPIAENYSEVYALTLIYKTDMGKFYIGGKSKPSADDPLLVLGADFKVNDIGVKFDFWSDKSGLSNQGEFAKAFWNKHGHQTVQATVNYDKITGQLMFSKPEDNDLDDVIGLGAAYQIDKWTVGTKYFIVDDKKADDGFYDVYGMYKVGAWDLKVGFSNAQFPFGQGGSNNAGAGSGDTQAFENEDGFLYAGVHFEF